MTREARIVYTAEDRTGPAAASVKKGVQSVAEVAGMAATTLAGLGAGVTIAGMLSLARAANDSVDALNDIKDATGSTVENLSALESIARRSGGSLDVVGSTLLKFNQALATTTREGSDASGILQELGLNAKMLRAMDPAQAVMETAKALNTFADDGEKARRVQVFFGRSLQEIAPFLKDVADAGELNATVTAEQAEAAERFNKQLYMLQTRTSDFGREITTAVLPTMSQLLSVFTDTDAQSSSLGNTIGKGLVVVLQTVGVVGLQVAHVLRETGRELGAMAAQAAAVATLDFKGFAAIRQARLDDAAQARRENDAAIDRMMGLAAAPDSSYDTLEARRFRPRSLRPRGDYSETRGRAQAVAQTKELTEAEKSLAAHVKYRRDLYLEEFDAEKKVKDDYLKAQQLQAKAEQDSIIAIEERAELILAEIDSFGKLQSQIERVKLARLQDAAAASAQWYGEGLDVINQQIAAQQRLIAALESRETLDAVKVAPQAANEEWERVADSLVDNLMRGGKSVAQYLKDLFRTLVLRPILAPVGQAVGGFLSGFGGNAAQVASGMGGGFNMNSMGLLGAGLQWMTGASAGASAASLGIANTVGALGGDALGTLIAANGSWAGVSAGAGAAAGASSIMGAIGTAMPYLAAALAVASALGLFDKKGGPKQEGYFNPYDSGKYFSSNSGDVASASRTAAQGLQAQYDTILEAYGRKGGLQFGLGYSMDPKGDAPTMLQIGAGMGGMQKIGIYRDDIGREQSDLQRAIAEEGARAVLIGLQQADLGGVIGQYLSDLGDVGKVAADKVTEAITRVQKSGAEKQALEDRLFALTATEMQQLARARERELEAVDESNRVLLQRVYAIEDERVAMEKMRAYADSLAAFQKDLQLGPPALLSPEARYQATKSEFQRLAQMAPNSEERMEGMESAGRAFLEASQAYNASSMAYFADLALVRGSVGASESAARTHVQLAQLQLEVSRQQVVELQKLVQKQDEIIARQDAQMAQHSEGYQQQQQVTQELFNAITGVTRQIRQSAPVVGGVWVDVP